MDQWKVVTISRPHLRIAPRDTWVAVGYMSDSWFRLGSWSPGSWDWAQLSAQSLGGSISLLPSLPLLHSCSHSLSKIINKLKKKPIAFRSHVTISALMEWLLGLGWQTWKEIRGLPSAAGRSWQNIHSAIEGGAFMPLFSSLFRVEFSYSGPSQEGGKEVRTETEAIDSFQDI